MNIIQIAEIAELAGVSKSTVSRVLSGNGSVSQKSYDKVMRVVNEIDYRPNPYARILNKKSTSLIGIIVPDIINPYFPQIIQDYFQTHPNIDGIFTDNDSIAFMVLRILHSLKIEVPSKMKIIGYDDNFMIPMIYPALSTIHQPVTQIGQLAAQTLINMINRQQINYQNILDVSYVKRNTTII